MGAVGGEYAGEDRVMFGNARGEGAVGGSGQVDLAARGVLVEEESE